MPFSREFKQSSSWRVALALFFITSTVESLGMSHVFSFLPVYLSGMDVSHISVWVGLLTALTFIVGLPLVPLWGIWADMYSGKAVIVRSAIVEALVFGLLGVSHVFSGVVFAMALVGFQLGNTGVMLSSIRRLVPVDKVGFAVSLFSVSSPIGMALGPLAGGWLVDHTSVNLHWLFIIDGVLSVGTAALLLALYREQTAARPTGQRHVERQLGAAWTAAWASVRTTFTLRVTWILFGIYTLLMIGRQMVNPYLPIAIQHLYPHSTDLTTVIGVWMGITALVAAAITVVTGRLGDKVGFARVLAIAFGINALCVFWLSQAAHVALFGVCLTGYTAGTGIGGAMIFALLSTMVPEAHRTTALNLVYLPLYCGGIVGPAVSSALARYGLNAQFTGASVLFLCSVVTVCWWLIRRPSNAAQGQTPAM